MVAIHRYCACHCKNPAGYVCACSHCDTDVGKKIAHKRSVRAKCARTADLPKHISSRRPVGEGYRGIARSGKCGPYLENVHTTAVESEFARQLRRIIETIDTWGKC